ncbi:hypothetical protein [Streptomyces sp. Je 1-369]|uniref:hypothetical protein n=1 Tax=Streptomyces sp. Je 1-369 TaxID=2966192 RepID=UPI0022865D90|nr:hypothetical protein [Streptomyces sp. Je 1-369]WAL93994.1 hypothetical protein NOO62_05445 [Streptomyces sp. Je 1-369]
MNKFRIEAPVRSYTGESVGVSFTKGTGYVDDSTKEGRAAIEYFRRQAYGIFPADEATEEDTEATSSPETDEALTNLGHGSAPSVGLGIGTPEQQPPVTPVDFDPSKRSQDEVIAYLDMADDDEVQRVKAAEAAGKDRKQIAAYERKTTPVPQKSGDDAKGQSA